MACVMQIYVHVIYNASRGKDFRHCFKKIGGLRALTDVPIIALTATAPQVTRETICSSLGLTEPAVILHTLDRPNIYFSTWDLNVSGCVA